MIDMLCRGNKIVMKICRRCYKTNNKNTSEKYVAKNIYTRQNINWELNG